MLTAKQTLLEGFPFLTAVERDFLPDSDNTSKKLYDFQLIERALKAHGLERFLPNLVDVVVFDAIIGNSDRHQENWGFIFQRDELNRQFNSQQVRKLESAAVMPIPSPNWRNQLMGNLKDDSMGFKKLINRIRSVMLGSIQVSIAANDHVATSLANPPPTFFTPIFDSGSSLGRELPNDKIEQMLRDSMQFDSYIRRGKSEIHWSNRKISHGALIAELVSLYGDTIRNRVSSVQELYKPDQIASLLASTDEFIPHGKEFDHYRLTNARQEFMLRIISTRMDSLFKDFSRIRI
ncbi:hypothetical protein D0T11_04930 [Hymenobacter rubripertinctus]|uniref:HipA-like C-terminal domain-containing protein n=2 Tax=Hymenobacter rubripertinctus TaxID=2029981 RepID=A0A418R4U8_9BACT|nr:hypothetical protein D0T11_04930 [Hymenobacter rubripertinctus]